MTGSSDLIGRTFAHYEITAHLGTGGMGEVYRAHDSKLDREVALKLLPAAFANDPERVARFAREATTLARLQHANIATIYGFERDAEQPFLVMELVEGEDLAERLRRGRLPVDEAIRLAEQIAEGLEAAHALGIVHRDLKPANIKLTPLGDVKILDFGLARAYAAEGDTSGTMEVSNSPTITAAMTLAGTIIGTAAYMSPEQARGKTIDRQADVWAYGVVFYEMLTATRLFGGETVSDSIGAILHRDPDLTVLPAVPPQVTTLLRRCLMRDKRERLRDIGDARLELVDARRGVAGPVAAGPRGSRRNTIIAAVLGAIVAVAGWWVFSPNAEPAFTQVTIGVPRDQAVFMTEGSWTRLRFAADGRHIAYAAGQNDQLFLRDIGEFAGVPLSASGASLCEFSPDGKWIAYFGQSKLWKIAVSGGAPIELCDTSQGPGLAWGRGEIYFSPANGGGLWAVSEDGGEPRQISTPDDAREETSHRWPHVLPDGRHLLTTIKTARISTFDDAEIGLLDLDTGKMSVLLKGGSYAVYASTGHLVYGRDTQLFAVPFDLKSLRVTGTPSPVLDQVYTIPVNGSAHFALSPGGNLAYLPVDGDIFDLELLWIDMNGSRERLETENSSFYYASMSPDSSRIAGMISQANDKIFIYDIQRRTLNRLTDTPGNDGTPCWSPDGRWIAYANDRSGSNDVYLIPADGSAPAHPLVTGSPDDYPASWTPDSARLLFTRIDAGGRGEIWSVAVDGEAEPELVLGGAYSNLGGFLSPDGRWLTYDSNVSGDFEIYVRPFERPGGAVRVSIGGGSWPQWSPDGRTLYFISEKGMMAAVIHTADGLRAGVPELLFEFDDSMFGGMPLSADGTRFLVNRAKPGTDMHYGIRVVFDWTEKLRALPR